LARLTTVNKYILNAKRNYTLLHLIVLPGFKIIQYKLLVPKCLEDIYLTFAKPILLLILLLKLPENISLGIQYI